MEMLNDSPCKTFCVFYTVSCVSYKARERSFELDTEPEDHGVSFELIPPLAYIHTTSVRYLSHVPCSHVDDYRSRYVTTEIGRTLSTVHLDSVPVSSCRSKAQ